MANKTILISPYGRHEEAVASAAIKCGYLCEIHTSSGEKVRPHADEDGPAEMLIAHEDALQGRSRATDYAQGDVVQLRILQKGDEFIGRLKASENVAIGDKLVSAGDGTFKKQSSSDTTTAHSIVLATAREASNVASVANVIMRVV